MSVCVCAYTLWYVCACVCVRVSRAIGDGACCWRGGCGETGAATDSTAVRSWCPDPAKESTSVRACSRVLGRFLGVVGGASCVVPDVVRRCVRLGEERSVCAEVWVRYQREDVLTGCDEAAGAMLLSW